MEGIKRRVKKLLALSTILNENEAAVVLEKARAFASMACALPRAGACPCQLGTAPSCDNGRHNGHPASWLSFPIKILHDIKGELLRFSVHVYQSFPVVAFLIPVEPSGAAEIVEYPGA
ncbi:MAG: DUF2786 domain-containing protein, partial [Spirochaetaceae bacterium]|nr:DUF2786 domain-containing protein [Spirochaetaceae bacterium]